MYNPIAIVNDYITDEYERNYQYYQEQVVIEDFFTFAEGIGRYDYARGCAGGYGPSTWNTEKGKRVKCSSKSFDCGGILKAYGVVKGILTTKEVGRNNSRTLYEQGQPISPEIAERGDYTYRELIKGEGSSTTHGAIVSKPMSGGTITIFDGLGGKFSDRELKLRCTEDYCLYYTTRGVYKIRFSTNPLVELAQQRNIEVSPFVEQVSEEAKYPGREYKVEDIADTNPLGYYITIDGREYDSKENRLINWWYVRNKDIDMIGTFYCENQQFDMDASSHTNDHGLCQLSYTFNKQFINTPERGTFYGQAQICLDKWNIVSDKNIRVCYAKRKEYIEKINFLDGGNRTLLDK